MYILRGSASFHRPPLKKTRHVCKRALKGSKRAHQGLKKEPRRVEKARGRPKWGTHAPLKGSKWVHGKPKLTWGELWVAKMQPESAQVWNEGPGGDFGSNFGAPKGTQKRSKLTQKNVTKFEAVTNTILGSDLDHFGYPKRNKISQSKEANEHDRKKTHVTKYTGKTNEKYTFLEHVEEPIRNAKGLGRHRFKFQTNARFWNGNLAQIGSILGTFWSSNRKKNWN